MVIDDARLPGGAGRQGGLQAERGEEKKRQCGETNLPGLSGFGGGGKRRAREPRGPSPLAPGPVRRPLDWGSNPGHDSARASRLLSRVYRDGRMPRHVEEI